MSWDSLSTLLKETTSTLNLSKELNQILLEELKRSETNLLKHLGNKKDVERIVSNDNVERKSIAIQTEDQTKEKETLEDGRMENFQIDKPSKDKDEIVSFQNVEMSFEIKPENEDENDISLTNKVFKEEDSLWTFNSENEFWSGATKDSNAGDTDQSQHNNEQHFSKEKVELHERENKYKCNNCNKAFALEKSLKRHENIHKDNSPYKCNTCSKVCSNNSDLMKHERIHTGEKPFECKICKKAFSTSSHLKSHGIIHSGEKPYVCKTCTKTFARIDCLKRHKRIHTDEKHLNAKYAIKHSYIQSNSKGTEKFILLTKDHLILKMKMELKQISSHLIKLSKNIHQRNLNLIMNFLLRSKMLLRKVT